MLYPIGSSTVPSKVNWNALLKKSVEMRFSLHWGSNHTTAEYLNSWPLTTIRILASCLHILRLCRSSRIRLVKDDLFELSCARGVGTEAEAGAFPVVVSVRSARTNGSSSRGRTRINEHAQMYVCFVFCLRYVPTSRIRLKLFFEVWMRRRYGCGDIGGIVLSAGTATGSLYSRLLFGPNCDDSGAAALTALASGRVRYKPHVAMSAYLAEYRLTFHAWRRPAVSLIACRIDLLATSESSRTTKTSSLS
jgi:hypothetical protein